jgi:hypothetical protein
MMHSQNAYGAELSDEDQPQHIDPLGPNQKLGEVVSERPVAVGIAEVGLCWFQMRAGGCTHVCHLCSARIVTATEQ